MILKVQEILEQEGWHYEKRDNDVLLVVSYLTRKWKMVVSCDGDGRICCFSVYPWQAAADGSVTADRQAAIMAALNDLNLAQRRGCFMLNPKDLSVVYRCGVQILDEFTAQDYIKDILFSSVASVNRNWEKIYSIIRGGSNGERCVEY